MSPEHPGYAFPDLLAGTDWLAGHLTDPNVRIVDMGMPDGYLRAHISGAVHPGPERSHWLKDPNDPLHVLPAGLFQALLETWGIGDNTTVVAYDEDGGHQAARLWSVMRHYGNDHCKVLDGGWNQWLVEGRPGIQAIPHYGRATFTPRQCANVFSGVEDVKALVGKPAGQLLDVRSRGEWNGTVTRGNRRTGHIPGAAHMEWKDAVTDDGLKTFLPAERVRQKLAAAGVTPEKPVVTYCQGGVRASHTAFVLHMLGYKDVRIYDGSFAEWGNRDDVPIVTSDGR